MDHHGLAKAVLLDVRRQRLEFLAVKQREDAGQGVKFELLH